MTLDSNNVPAASSTRLITILQNNDGHLIAEQRPQSGNFLLVIGFILIVLFSAVLIYKHQWKRLLFPALAAVVLVPLWHSSTNPTYRIEVDKQAHKIVSEKLVDGKSVATSTIPATDLTSADMQFNRGARTIVLIHRDGHQSFPLGEDELQDEPDQYVILNALRQVIGQSPAAPQ